MVVIVAVLTLVLMVAVVVAAVIATVMEVMCHVSLKKKKGCKARKAVWKLGCYHASVAKKSEVYCILSEILK